MGPKAFRYALLRFERGTRIRFRSIHLAGINYPVKYQGFFQSSDEKLNRMWTVGAYTAHLCMQDDIWDAPKRDRGRWIGDLDVSGRTIEDVFDDHFLMEETLDRLIGEAPITHHVDGIAVYSAFWITGETEYYRHTGSLHHLESIHERLVHARPSIPIHPFDPASMPVFLDAGPWLPMAATSASPTRSDHPGARGLDPEPVQRDRFFEPQHDGGGHAPPCSTDGAPHRGNGGRRRRWGRSPDDP